MYLKSLKIINLRNNETIRSVTFHSGVNLIVDTENSEKHNKVGKTTFLRLIDIALGSQERDKLYYDESTNSKNLELENYIDVNKSAIELEVVDNLEFVKEEYLFKVELFKKGKYYINGTRCSQTKYRTELNKIFFDKDKKPTFRELIKSFVRISMNGDNNNFLKTLPKSSNSKFRAVYDFLFNVPSSGINETRGELSKNIKSVKNAQKEFKRVNNTQDTQSIREEVKNLEKKREAIDSKIQDIVHSKNFEEMNVTFSEIRKSYSNVVSEISQKEYRIKINNDYIRRIKDELALTLDANLISDFRSEIQKIFPKLDKSYEDLVAFNDQLFKNKIEFLNSINEELEKELSVLIAERDSLSNKNKELSSVITNSTLKDYNRLSKESVELSQQIASQSQILHSLENFQKENEGLESHLQKLNEELDKLTNIYEEKIKMFNNFFTKYAKEISGEEPYISYDSKPSEFPIVMRHINGISTGTKKTLIAAYDLAYQSFAKEEKKKIPNFVVHDVMENIEGGNLKNTFNIANNIDTQYIVAILKEKLDSSNITQDEQNKMKIISLSMNSRLFRS